MQPSTTPATGTKISSSNYFLFITMSKSSNTGAAEMSSLVGLRYYFVTYSQADDLRFTQEKVLEKY